MGPPKALDCPNPMSSIRTIRTLGAFCGAFTSNRGGGVAFRTSNTVMGGFTGSGIGSTVRSVGYTTRAAVASSAPAGTTATGEHSAISTSPTARIVGSCFMGSSAQPRRGPASSASPIRRLGVQSMTTTAHREDRRRLDDLAYPRLAISRQRRRKHACAMSLFACARSASLAAVRERSPSRLAPGVRPRGNPLANQIGEPAVLIGGPGLRGDITPCAKRGEWQARVDVAALVEQLVASAVGEEAPVERVPHRGLLGVEAEGGRAVLGERVVPLGRTCEPVDLVEIRHQQSPC